MCYQSNISAAVQQSKIELKEGMEIYCHTEFKYADGSIANCKGWHKISQDPRDKVIYLENSGWVIGQGLKVDEHFDLSNPRWPEKMEKDNGGWIDVKDRLPEYKQRVLIHCNREYSHSPSVIIGSHYGDHWCSTVAVEDEILHVTHWQPLPPAPNHLTSK